MKYKILHWKKIPPPPPPNILRSWLKIGFIPDIWPIHSGLLESSYTNNTMGGKKYGNFMTKASSLEIMQKQIWWKLNKYPNAFRKYITSSPTKYPSPPLFSFRSASKCLKFFGAPSMYFVTRSFCDSKNNTQVIKLEPPVPGVIMA